MFTAVRKEVLRWGTPDPEGDWMMYGHLLIRDSGCILIDPPLVPGLLGAVGRLGKAKAVILTTLDHTRGAGYISAKTGATIYVPDQDPTQVDPGAVQKKENFTNFELYSAGNVLELEALRLTVKKDKNGNFPGMDEFALLTEKKELITGDMVIGTDGGRISVAPEWFPHDPPLPAYKAARTAVKDLIQKTGAVSLLASHGNDIYGTLLDSVTEL